MNLATTYLLNVGLHSAVLSVFASLLLAFLREPAQRSFVAIAGLITVGFLPWATALRPVPEHRGLPPVVEIQTALPMEFPVWTIATVPMENPTIDPPATPVHPSTKWEFPDVPTSLLLLWATGSGIAFSSLGIALVKVIFWKKSLILPDGATWHALQSLDVKTPSRRHFRICGSTASPCVIGFWQPKIVIPRFLLEADSTQKLRWTVNHELAHWQAGDSRWVMLFALIRCVTWWNPFTHHLIAIWADAREQLCDLHATGDSENRADYGEFLIAMARHIGKQAPLSVAMAKRLHARRLKQRIVSLLDSKADDVTPLGKGFVSISTGLFITVAASVSVLKIGAENVPIISDATSNGEVASELTEQPSIENITPSATPPQPPVTNNPGASAPAAASKRVNRQIKISTKLILTDFEPGFDGKVPDGGRFALTSIFSEGQMQLIMSGFAREHGTRLSMSPTLLATSGQETTMEIIRGVLGTPEQVRKRKSDSIVPFVGIRISTTPQFSDELPPYDHLSADSAEPVPYEGSIELDLDVEYHFIPGHYQPMEESNGNLPKGLNPDEIKIVRKTVSGMSYSGYTVATQLGEIEPGKYLTVFTRADAIDTDGDPIDFQKIHDKGLDRQSIIVNKRRADEGTLPLPEIPGSIRLSATLVDLPLVKPRPPGEGLVIGLTPTSKTVADKIKNTPGGKVRKLKTIDVPLNQRITPWPEFSGLSLTALASKNHKVVSLTSHATGSSEEEFPNTWEQAPGDVMNFGIRTAGKSIERRLLITLEEVK